MRQSQMVPCPHCGTPNSDKKQVCYHCRQTLVAVPEETVAQRTLTTRDTVVSRPADLRAKQRTRSRTTTTTSPAAPVSPLFATLPQRAQLYHQCHRLLAAGFSPAEMLTQLQEVVAPYLRPALQELAAQVQHGGTLSEGIARYPGIFREWEAASIRAGEVGGILPEVLADMADALDLEINVRMRVMAVTYNLRATAVFVVLIAAFVDTLIGKSLGIANLVQSIGAALLHPIALVLGFFGLRYVWRRVFSTRWGAEFAYAWTCRFPLTGSLMQMVLKRRFVRVLKALWNAGVAPMEAVEVAARTTASDHYRNTITAQAYKLGEGVPLSEVFAATGLFAPEEVQMIRIVETSGTIPDGLEKIEDYVKMEMDGQIMRLPVKVTLIAYLILALIIGFAFLVAIMANYQP